MGTQGLDQSLRTWQASFDSRSNPAGNDFRSDTVTLPNGDMLSSILLQSTSFGDDVFSEDGPTNYLEEYIGELTGMGNAVFVLSGTMGNHTAIRCHLKQPPHSIVCDRRSHIFEYECGMASMFSQAHLIPALPQKEAYLTLEDIIPNIVPDDGDTHGAPTRLITLENTFWGRVTPLAEVQRISEYARSHGIALHMDGARLWNACYTNSMASLGAAEASAQARATLKEYCGYVDSVSMCFSKSLGSPTGAVLAAHSPQFIQRARHIRKALGGGIRQSGVLAAPALVAVDSIFLSGEPLMHAVKMARELEQSWVELGGLTQSGLGQETNMVWLDLKAAGVTDDEFVKIAEREGVKVFDGRIVTHYQITESAVEALKRTFKKILVGN
ncbi:pyridoxal phosphate-dependent transferase [Apiospora sp. TS-2023a]